MPRTGPSTCWCTTPGRRSTRRTRTQACWSSSQVGGMQGAQQADRHRGQQFTKEAGMVSSPAACRSAGCPMLHVPAHLLALPVPLRSGGICGAASWA